MKKKSKKYQQDFSKKSSDSSPKREFSRKSNENDFPKEENRRGHSKKNKKASNNSIKREEARRSNSAFSDDRQRNDSRPTGRSRFKKSSKVINEPKAPVIKREEQEGEIRLNKYIAHCGVCSRRKADEYIKEGKIKVNGTKIDQPGHKIMPNDKVYFEGKLLKIEEDFVYILMNKPKNTITSLNDEKGRRTVIDLIKTKCPQRVYPVGRLDKDTTGLLLITNDGDAAKKLAHPSHGVSKVYHATLDKPLTKHDLEHIQKTVELEDGPAPVVDAQYVIGAGKKEIGIEIHIGRNRIVRRIFEHLGYTVEKLDRVYFGGFTKKDIPRGKWRYLNEKEVIMLKHFL